MKKFINIIIIFNICLTTADIDLLSPDPKNALRPMAAAKYKPPALSKEQSLNEYADSIINNYAASDRATILLKIDDRKNIEFDLHKLGFDISGAEEIFIRSFIMSPSKSRDEISTRQKMLKAIISEKGFSLWKLLEERRSAHAMLEGILWLCQRHEDVTRVVWDAGYDEKRLLAKLRDPTGEESERKALSVLRDIYYHRGSLTAFLGEIKKIKDPLMKHLADRLEAAMKDFEPFTAETIIKTFADKDAGATVELAGLVNSVSRHLSATGSFLSFAKYAKENGFARAGFDSTKPEGYEESWNFTRRKKGEDKEQILNSILFDNPATTIFVGSNMSGKTYFLIQDLFIQMLGQAFGYIPASSGNLRIYKKIIFIDRVSAEETHDLGAHGKDCKEKWKKAVEIADSDTKVNVDEGFSATSSLDQLCLLDGAHNLFVKRGARYMVATHNEAYILNQIEKPDTSIYWLKIEIEKGRVDYKYKLEKVAHDLSLIDSRALEVARSLGLNERIIEKAQRYINREERSIQSIRRKILSDVVPYSEDEREALKKQQADGFLAFLPMDNILLPAEYHMLCAKYEFRGDDSHCLVRSREEKRVYEPVFRAFSDNPEFYVGGSFAFLNEDKLIMRILLTGSTYNMKELLERQKMFSEMVQDDGAYKDGKLEIAELGNRILTYLYGIAIHSPKYYANINFEILRSAYNNITAPHGFKSLDYEDFQMFLDLVDTILSLNGLSAEEAGISEYVNNIKAMQSFKRPDEEAFIKEVNAIIIKLFKSESEWLLWDDKYTIQQFLDEKASKGFPNIPLLKPVSCFNDADIEKLKIALERFKDMVTSMERKYGLLQANFNPFVNIVRRLDVLLNEDDIIGRFCDYLRKYDSVHMHQFANYFENLLRHVSNNVKNGREFFRMLDAFEKRDVERDNMPCRNFNPAAIYPEMWKLYAIFGLAKLIRDEEWAQARFHKKPQLIVKKAWNPGIDKVSQIRNDSYFDLNELIRIYSGANKSGKSYNIRQLIWAIISAQVTGFGPADEIVMPGFKRIVYLDRVGMTLDRNLSAFGTEAKNLSEFTDIMDSEEIVFGAADEIGSATSPKYQSALSYAVSEDSLSNGNMFAIASHNHDYIGRFMQRNAGHAKVYYFPARIYPDGRPHFTYEIREGHAPSYGVEIAKAMGLEELVSMIDPNLLAERDRVQSALADRLNIEKQDIFNAILASA